MFKVDAFLGSINLSLKEISSFQKGYVIDLQIPAGEKVKCFHNNSFLFEGDVMVYEKNLAVRIVSPFREEKTFEVEPLSFVQQTQSVSGDKKAPVSFDFLKSIEPSFLAEFIMTEHPQTIALILSSCDPDYVSDVFNLLPDDLTAEVLIRIAHLGDISPAILKMVAFTLEDKLKNLSSFRNYLGGVSFASLISSKLEEEKSKYIFKNISEVNQEVAAAIFKNEEKRITFFDDIFSLSEQNISFLSKHIESNKMTDVMSIALRNISQENKNLFLSSIPVKLKNKYLSKKSSLEININDILHAQNTILDLIRTLEETRKLK